MKFFYLVWCNLKRKKIRTLLTMFSILVAFLLYGYLSAIKVAFNQGIDVAGVDRLVVRHKVSIIQTLPVSYLNRIQALDGVDHVIHSTWFGGIYKEPRNFFAQIPVEPEPFLNMFPEFLLPDEQKEAWLKTRTGAIVGRVTADRFGWKVGDRIPIQATIWPKKDGSQSWEFDLVGIYDGRDKGTDTSQFFFRYDYFDEARGGGEGEVGWYTARVEDPDKAETVARNLDDRFANSAYETKTDTEKAFVQAFAKQVGNISAILMAILSATFFTILLVAGNTMAYSVQERLGELAVLKALGVTHMGASALVIAESILLASLGGLPGLGLAWLMIAQGDPTNGALPIFYFPVKDLLIGLGLVALLGLAVGLFPAIQAKRLQIADALRR